MSRHHLYEFSGTCMILMRGPLGVADIKACGVAWQVKGYGADTYGHLCGYFPSKRAALRAALKFAREFYARAGLVPIESLKGAKSGA